MKLLSLIVPNGDGSPITINGAGGMPEGGPGQLTNILGLGFQLLIIAAIFLALVNLIWGGINWIMSEGNKDRVGKARERIVNSILGLLIVFLSFFIINIIYYFFFKNTVNPFIFNH
jgi:hypothetical protein